MSSWITSQWASELRQLWNEYDPIGVYSFGDESSDCSQDEYDSYHGLILRHLNNQSTHDVIYNDVLQLATGHIGLSLTTGLESNTSEFVDKVMTWFESKKPELKNL